MIKFIPFIAYMFFIPFEAYSLDSDFYRDLKVMEDEYQELAKQEGVIRDVLESQAKRIAHKFFNQKMRSEDLAKDFEVFMSNRNITGIDDMMKAIQEFLTKIFGSKAAEVIIKVLGLADSTQAIKDVFEGFKQLQDPIKCDNGVYLLAGGLSYIAGAVAVMYAFYGNPYAIFLATAAGTVARMSSIVVLDVTNLPKYLCDLIHKREFYEIYNF